MGKLVDVEPIILQVQRCLIPNLDIDGTISVEQAERYFIKLLRDAPEVTKAESSTKIGRWNLDGSCNVCGAQVLSNYTNFCPKCGANMEGGH